jgi:hypothetical protein
LRVQPFGEQNNRRPSLRRLGLSGLPEAAPMLLGLMARLAYKDSANVRLARFLARRH